MFTDYHMHTFFSNDSVYPMEEEIQDAIALGLEEICFTDHIDIGTKNKWNTNYTAPKNEKRGTNCDTLLFQKEFLRCKEIYQDQITLKMGMEFGMQSHTISSYEEIFAQYPFDFIILSCHQVGNQEFWTYEFQNGKTQDEYQRLYYEEILKVIRTYKNYSVLGHLDAINRYGRPDVDLPKYPFDRVKDVIAEILTLAISDGKGIEVNTSSFRYKVGDYTPSMDILKLYKELGGEILTIGSDTHTKEHVGYQIPETMEMLKQLGYSHIYTFDQMRPIGHLL